MKPFCFSLSGIYESEGYAWEQAGKIWDLRELRGTDGYLDPETEQFLEAELGRKKETKELPRIRLLDSGNYHYMSKLLLGLEKRRFVFSRIRPPYRYAAAGASSGALLRFPGSGMLPGRIKTSKESV